MSLKWIAHRCRHDGHGHHAVASGSDPLCQGWVAPSDESSHCVAASVSRPTRKSLVHSTLLPQQGTQPYWTLCEVSTEWGCPGLHLKGLPAGREMSCIETQRVCPIHQSPSAERGVTSQSRAMRQHRAACCQGGPYLSQGQGHPGRTPMSAPGSRPAGPHGALPGKLRDLQ